MRHFRISLILFFLLFGTFLSAQKGFIRGTVFDDQTGEFLPGITILIEGTSIGAVTDLDGNFNIEIEPGTYTLKVSFISYETLVVSDIQVKPKEVFLLDNIRLKEARIQLAEVTITAKEIRNTEGAINTIKMKSANVMDGISAFTLKKIGDSDAASSMKRVPGVSVEGGKYVFVRGLGDRYTKTTLNGLDIPGLDPDRNSLQIDIFPTNIIDNLIVQKSFTADLAADFTGGIVNIEIKDFPEEKKGSIVVGAGYNPNSHFNSDYLSYQGGKTDFLGFDDGTREIPVTDNIPYFTDAIVDPNGTNGTRYKEILGSFSQNMASMKENSFMDYNLAFTFGNQHPLKRVTIGYNFAFSYKNNTDFYSGAEYGRYGIPSDDSYELVTRTFQKGDFGQNNVFLSGLAGFAVKTKYSKFRIYLLHLQNGESRAGIFDFISADLGSEFVGYQHILDYSQRSLSNLLIDGKHIIKDGRWNIDWKISPTLSRMEDPDVRFTRYINRNNVLYVGTESGFPERIWRDLEETNLSGVLNITREFDFNKQKAKLKFGTAYTYKSRDYSLRKFVFNIRQWDDPLTGNPNELFDPENLWPRFNNLNQGTTYDAPFYPDNTNQYSASLNSSAAYASVEFGMLKNLKSIIGLRYENYIQYYTGQNQQGTKILDNDKVLDDTDIFPAISLIYSLSERQNLRFSFSKTIARPSMKELSFAEIYDPITGITFIGALHPEVDNDKNITYWDGNLESTDIQNFDLRWELFQSGGSMISVSGFYKKFDKPIEIVQYTTTQKPSIQPRNVGDGQVYGAEIEFRQSMDLINESLKNFTLMLNFTYVESKIKMSQTEYESRVTNARPGQTIDEYRDMAGQAPYIVNAGFSYNGGTTGFWKGFEAGLYYNVQGQSLLIVGISDRPDIYSVPFHSLNFNSSKSMGKKNRFQLSLKIDNILNSYRESVYKSYQADDKFYSKLQQGVTFEIKLGYNLF
ncbi:MAG: TonB-dependent receptor [Bacteroidales bacterium]